jgi:uncharacterized protein (TIGR03790 family)
LALDAGTRTCIHGISEIIAFDSQPARRTAVSVESVFWYVRISLRIIAVLFTLLSAGYAGPPLNRRVLIVYDRQSPDSRKVALYYGRSRKIPTPNLCAVEVPTDPSGRTVEKAQYLRAIRDPIRACLQRVGREQILYIVLSYIRPNAMTIAGSTLTYYGIDSYLSDIWDVYLSGNRDQPPVPVSPHPYYVNNRARDSVFFPFMSFAEMRDKPGAPLIYAVWRLDGPTPKIAQSLVDKAIRAEAAHGPKGQACIDERRDPVTFPDEGYFAGDWDLYRAAEFLRKAGISVLEDQRDTEFGTPPSPNCPNAALYAGWYKMKHYNDAFQWNDGAIGFHMDSLSAHSVRDGESWAANALQRGITVTSGAMNEPYLAGLPRPSGIFHDLLAGSNVGDALLRNTRYLKWMIVNVGDPLYTPFTGGVRRKE